MELKTTFAQHGAGSLSEELSRVQKEVRAQPADEKLRTYLFQLLAVQGNWQRALEQLQVCAQLSAKALPMAHMYREAIRSELFRADVFTGKRAPQVLGEPPGWVGMLIESLQRLAAGDTKTAASLRAAAFEEAPASAGSVDGESEFEWIADADSRLGPVCECIVNGQYYWIPFFRIRSVRIDPPAVLRDIVWVSASLALENGGEHVALIPSRYPGTESSTDDTLKLARRTEWKEIGDEAFAGCGQRMLATDNAEFALLDVRQIDIRA
jgi:type VI secretion system protein ImpE